MHPGRCTTTARLHRGSGRLRRSPSRPPLPGIIVMWCPGRVLCGAHWSHAGRVGTEQAAARAAAPLTAWPLLPPSSSNRVYHHVPAIELPASHSPPRTHSTRTHPQWPRRALSPSAWPQWRPPSRTGTTTATSTAPATCLPTPYPQFSPRLPASRFAPNQILATMTGKSCLPPTTRPRP